MQHRRIVSFGLLCSMLPTSAWAETIDTSGTLICALSDVQVCAPGGPCALQTVESLDAPYFLMVSVAAKKITGTRPSGSPVDAKIELVHRSQESLFLQGTQEAFDWTLAIAEGSGKMTLTLADSDHGAVAFGACIAR